MSSPTSSQRFVEHDDSQLGATNAEHYERGDGDGIPFLVTHWLEQFANVDNQEISTQEQAEAFEKIRRATSDLASAFSTLGAYGTINAVSLSTPNLCRGANSKNILFHIFCFPNFLIVLTCYSAFAAATIISFALSIAGAKERIIF